MNNILIDERILKLSSFNKVIENIIETDYTQRSETITSPSNHIFESVFDILENIKNTTNQTIQTNSSNLNKKNKEDDYVISIIKSKEYDKLTEKYDLVIIENLEITFMLITNNKEVIISIDNKVVDDEKEIYTLFADKFNELSYSTLCRLFKFINSKNKNKQKIGKQKRKDLENNIHNFFMNIK